MMVPFLGSLNIRCRIILEIQQGTMILTTTHMTKGIINGVQGLGLKIDNEQTPPALGF